MPARDGRGGGGDPRLKAGGHDPVLVFGASAIVDRGDVVPAGLSAAGGKSFISACRSTPAI